MIYSDEMLQVLRRPNRSLDNLALPECTQCADLALYRAGIQKKNYCNNACQRCHEFTLPGYWAKPVNSFGDPSAEILLVGMAPGFHGANRTGRPFTGDDSGNFLFSALFDMRFASRCRSFSRDDGLTLTNVRITNAVRCVPPANKVTAGHIDACSVYLACELFILKDTLKFVVALGTDAHRAVLRVLKQHFGVQLAYSQYGFEDGKCHNDLFSQTSLRNGCRKPPVLVDAYHPSPINSATDRTSWDHYHNIFEKMQRDAHMRITRRIDTTVLNSSD